MKILKVILALPLLLLGCNDSTYKPSAWRAKVPAAVRSLSNPLPQTSAHIDQGRAQYGLYCASCHGEDAAGRRSKPSLRNARVRGETDGEIYWILENGSKGHGMPAWRSLGDTSIWQIIEYIRSMPPAR